MASILDNVKRGLSTIQPGTPADLNATTQVQQLAQATTGKETTGSTTVPKASQMASNLAAQETLVQQRQQQLQQQQTAAQLGVAEQQQEQAIKQQKRRMSIQELGQRERAYQKINEIFDNVEVNKARLDQAKYKSQMEQAGFLLRLNNDKYVTKLKIEGRKNRLHNELQFKEALQRAVFKEEADMFNSNLKFRKMMNADERAFKEDLEYMELDFAFELADTKAVGENERAKTQAIAGIFSGAMGAGAQIAGETMKVEKPQPIQAPQTTVNYYNINNNVGSGLVAPENAIDGATYAEQYGKANV